MSARTLALIGLAGVGAAALVGLASGGVTTGPATYFMHIKNTVGTFPDTIGKVQQIYSSIYYANRSGHYFGLEPQCIAPWATQVQYLRECGNIPVMLNVLTSDDAVMLTLPQISEAMSACNVQCFRFHEALSYFQPSYTGQPFPTDYARSILQLAKTNNIPVFWNEWDVRFYDQTESTQYPKIQTVIAGYEDNVLVSFGTNNNWLEPVEGYQLLQQFQRRAASVQAWYWWERNGRVVGSENYMPPDLMVQHTQQAFQAGCEIVQYEPFSYFFDGATPKTTLAAVLGNL